MSSTPAFTASGLASGIDSASIITQLMSIERRPVTLMQQRIQSINLAKAQYQNIGSRNVTLQNTVKGLLAKSSLDENLFQSKKATSSNDKIGTATVTTDAAAQTIQLEVLNLATPTKAVGQTPLGAWGQGTDTLANLAGGTITDGNFTIYVNGQPSTITVDTAQTLDDVLNQITAIGNGITGASIVNGQIQIDYNSGTNIHIGAQSDTTNFARLTQLATATPGATSLSSTRPLTTLNTVVALSDPASGMNTPVTDGTFKINGVEFDTTGKTLNELLAEMNSSTEAGVSVTINRLTNKLEMRSKQTGSSFMLFEEGTSNFLSASGLVNGGDTTSSQTAGQNASFNLNGSLLYSATNNVGTDITGLTGVTLELKQATPGTTVDITVGRDTDKLKAQLDTLVKNINSLFDLIQTQTDPQGTGSLKGESSLTRYRSDLRTLLTGGVDTVSTFTSLASIGISTGAAGTGTGTTTGVYSLDTVKLEAALAANPAEVEKMLKGSGGILEQLNAVLDQANHDDTDNTLDGLFAAKGNTFSDQVKDLNSRIDAANARLEQKEALLRKQFQAMENIYSQSQQQQNSLNGLISQLGANK